jgi:putative ATP-binding cassette transporter
MPPANASAPSPAPRPRPGSQAPAGAWGPGSARQRAGRVSSAATDDPAPTPLARFIAEEPQAPRGGILFMAATVGAAEAGMIALINTAAEQVYLGSVPGTLAMAYLLLLGILMTALGYALVQSIGVVERGLERVKLRIADKVRRSDLRFIEVSGGSGAYRLLAQDSGIIAQGAGPMVLIAHQSVVVLFALVYVAWLSLPTLVVTLFVLGLAVPVIVHHAERTRADLKAAARDDDQVFDALGGMLAGFKELKLNRPERQALLADIERLARRAHARKLAVGMRQALDMIFATGLTYVVLFAAVFVVAIVVPQASETVLAVSVVLLLVTRGLLGAANAMPLIAKVEAAIADLYRLEDRLDTAAAHAEGPIAAPSRAGFQQIALSGLGFRYRDAEGSTLFEVGPFDLTLTRGEMLFIVGGNGSGKSTLLKLLTGLYRPDYGTLSLDGQRLADADYPSYPLPVHQRVHRLPPVRSPLRHRRPGPGTRQPLAAGAGDGPQDPLCRRGLHQPRPLHRPEEAPGLHRRRAQGPPHLRLRRARRRPRPALSPPLLRGHPAGAQGRGPHAGLRLPRRPLVPCRRSGADHA